VKKTRFFCPLVPDVVSAQTAQRLQSLKNEVLGRSSLTTLINDKKLYPKIVRDYSIEDAVEQMMKDINVRADVQLSGEHSFATSVEVRFAYSDRYKAREVVTALTDNFINANMNWQTMSAKKTASFVGDQLKEAGEKLDTLNDAIAKFRQENAGKLPEQAAANGQQLANLQNQVNQANERINGLGIQKNTLQTTLNGQNEFLSLVAQAPDDASAPQTVKNQKLIALDAAIRNQQMQLAALKEKFQDNWPAVQESEAQLRVLKDEQTREQAAQEEESSAASPEARVRAQAQKKTTDLERSARLELYKNQIAGLQQQIANADIEIQQNTQEKAELNRRIVELQAKIDASPGIEQQYANLTRDVKLAQERYDQLKKQEDLSQTAKDLQETGSGEMLQLSDPANLPINPSKPNRWMIAGGGTSIGMLFGFILAGAREARDTSLKNLKDVRAYANLPVLSSIPLLENALLVRRKRRLLWLGWSTAVMIGLSAVSVSMWYYYTGGAKQ